MPDAADDLDLSPEKFLQSGVTRVIALIDGEYLKNSKYNSILISTYERESTKYL
jgi:hypothetical protein